MIIGNKALRDHAQPFISEFIESSSLSYGGSLLDNPEYLDTGGLTVAVPMTQPEKGDITEAYLFMEMVAPSNYPLDVFVGIGYYAGGANEIVPQTSYTNAYLLEQHVKATGHTDPLHAAAGATLLVEADFSRSIPRRGDSDFVSDGFVLLVTFLKLPEVAFGYELSKFKLSCTAQMGLGT